MSDWEDPHTPFWNKQTHHFFPNRFKFYVTVFTFCVHFISKKSNYKFPKPILSILINMIFFNKIPKF